MSGYLSHESADGRTVLERTRTADFGGCAVREDMIAPKASPSW